MLKLDHAFTATPTIQKLLTKLQALSYAANLISVSNDNLEYLRGQSRLTSALFSAKIEGNKITPDSYDTTPPNLEKLEITNLYSTYNWLYSMPSTIPIDIPLIKLLHKKSMNNLRSDAGQFRVEQSAIFNEYGVAVYLTPPAQEIVPLMELWLSKPPQSITDVLMSHFQFEKIHPFLDGNGRIGRLLLTQHLRSLGLDFHGLISFEKSIEESRSTYYYHLQNSGSDLTSWIEYLLTEVNKSASLALEKINQPKSVDKKKHRLLPRRQEILLIIQDHSPCSFDFIRRRFMAIPSSTLRYDLLQLQKQHLIEKLGNTRGALYSSTELPE